jgi:gluconolactonase
MRGWLVGLSCLSLIGFGACSEDDSDPDETVGAITPSPGSGAGGTSSVASAGSAGAAGSASRTADGGSAPTSEGNEGNPDPTGIVGQAGSTDGSGPVNGDDGDDGAGPDAGPPAVAEARCPAGPFADSPLPGGVAPAPQTLCGGMTFTEGAVWFAERNTLFFSDFQLNNPAVGRIMSFTPGGQCQELIANAGTNGLVIAPDGNLLGARHSDQTLTLFDLETLEPTVLVADNAGLAFNSPNDIVVRSDGNLYFTDPTFLRGNRPEEQPQATYRRDPSGALSVIDTGANPNGIALSPDESRLYLAHLGAAGDVVAFDLDADGGVGDPQPLITTSGSDGMAIDCAGNLYLTAQPGVQIFSPDGDPIGTIAAQGAANLAFGGPDRQTLFITATSSLLAVDLAIPGLPY